KFWHPADMPLIGPITYGTAGLALFGLAYLFILRAVWRLERTSGAAAGGASPLIGRGEGPPAGPAHWYLAAAAVASAFFTLSTHMHENHAFALLPLLILLADRGRRWFALLLVAAASIGVNMLTHDYILSAEVWSKIGGNSGYYHPGLFRDLSRLELAAAKANSVVTLGICAVLLASLARFTPRSAAPRTSAR
ncbi:MAG: hypothetical protein FJY75_11670, partial [Candidatus Eisenbacteria bacterium]|nr:hypothetical protein [Candidatus Eisenbacteria bacterium]